LNKASPKIQVLKVACSRGMMNTEPVDLSNRGHYILLQTPGGVCTHSCVTCITCNQGSNRRIYRNVSKTGGPLK